MTAATTLESTWSALEATARNGRLPLTVLRANEPDALAEALARLAEDAMAHGWSVVLNHEATPATYAAQSRTTSNTPTYVAVVTRAATANPEYTDILLRTARSQGGYVIVGALAEDPEPDWLSYFAPEV